MDKQVIYINARREGYAVDQIRKTMTVGELIAYLEQYEESCEVYLSHDNGYTYGGIREYDITDEWVGEEEPEEEETENEEQ